MSGSSRPLKSSSKGASRTCSSRFCTRLRTHAPSASVVQMRPVSFSLRKCSELVYQIHSTMSESQASAPYSSRQRTRFSFENVFRRQKISPTMPMTGWLPRARFGASLRKRSRQRTIESRSASKLHAGLGGRGFKRAAKIGERLFVEGLGIAAPLLVGAVDQERSLQQVGGQQRAPAGAHEGFRKAPDRKSVV